MKKYLALFLLLIVAMGATATRIDFTPLAPVKLIKANGTVVGYGYGSSTAADIGTVLQTAITASTSGDTVRLESDATVSSAISKDDLHLELADGVTLTCSTSSTVTLISDEGSAMDMYVSGHGRLVRASNGKGAVVKQTNASSNITIHCAEIINQKTSIGASPDKPNLEGATVFQDGGTQYIDAQLISGTFGPWWDAGDGYVRAQKIIGSGSAEYSLALYAEPDAGETGQWWVDCPHIKAPTPMLLRTASGSGTARIWIQSSLIEGSGVDVPKILIDNVFAYITCQKIVANADDTGYVPGWIDVSGGAHFYLWTQKFSTRGGGDGSTINISESGTVAYLNIDEVDDANGLPAVGFLNNATGTTYYTGKVVHLATASRDAFVCTSGSLTIQSGDISTQSSCKDLVRGGGTLTVSSAVKYDATKTTGTITKQNIYGVAPTTAGVALLDDADASAQRTTLGLGSSDSPTFAGASLVGAGQSAVEIDRTATTDYARVMYQTASTDQWGLGLRGDAATNNDWELYDEINSRHLIVGKLSGRVGILNTSPSTALDVTGTVTATLFSGSGASLTSLSGTNISSGTVASARMEAATTSAQGASELATTGETTIGTDTTRTITPDGFAHSSHGQRIVTLLVSDPQGSAITTGDGKVCFRVPTAFNGMNLILVGASCSTVSSSGAPAVQVRRSRRTNATTRSDADMLSTGITIDQSEFDTVDAATPAVVNGSNDDVVTGDMIYIDIDTAGTGCKGLVVNLSFQLP